MSVEENVRARIVDRIQSGKALSISNEYGQIRHKQQGAACIGWTGAAEHAVTLVCTSALDAYRAVTGWIVLKSATSGSTIPSRVAEFVALLEHLLADIDGGLITTVALLGPPLPSGGVTSVALSLVHR